MNAVKIYDSTSIVPGTYRDIVGEPLSADARVIRTGVRARSDGHETTHDPGRAAVQQRSSPAAAATATSSPPPAPRR